MQFIASCTKGALRTTRIIKLIWAWISSQIFPRCRWPSKRNGWAVTKASSQLQYRPWEKKILNPGDICITQTFPSTGENALFSVWYGAAPQPSWPSWEIEPQGTRLLQTGAVFERWGWIIQIAFFRQYREEMSPAMWKLRPYAPRMFFERTMLDKARVTSRLVPRSDPSRAVPPLLIPGTLSSGHYFHCSQCLFFCTT